MFAKVVVEKLIAAKLSLATAESCTGGLLAAAITAVPGSSQCYGYGIVSYSNQAKTQILQVQQQVIADYGAVSAPVAQAMAVGVKNLAGADIGVAITGIAGPGGGSEAKPVGLVYIGIVCKQDLAVLKFNFSGNRDQVRTATVNAALDLILQRIGANN